MNDQEIKRRRRSETKNIMLENVVMERVHKKTLKIQSLKKKIKKKRITQQSNKIIFFYMLYMLIEDIVTCVNIQITKFEEMNINTR